MKKIMNDLVYLRENGILKTLVLDKKVQTSKGEIKLFSLYDKGVETDKIDSSSIFKGGPSRG